MTSEISKTEDIQLDDDEEDDYKLLKIEDPKVLAYITNLKSLISRQRTLIFKLRNKLGSLQKPSMVDISIQTHENFDSVEKKSQDKYNNLSEDANWTTTGSDVANMVKEAAETAMGRTGFVFEKSSGMYYDYNTGYYYDAEHGLYYDGNSGTYYSYNKEKNEFEFYSQIYPESQEGNQCTDENSSQSRRKRRGKLEKNESKRKKVSSSSQIEEGECTDASSDDSKYSDSEDPNENNNSSCNFNDNSQTIKEVSNPWPPCMRIVVKESSLKDMTVGTLFIVTYTGGTLGREGDHAVLIPDINISKYHAKIVFSEEDAANKKGNYTLTDLGSRNGTYLNGTRLSTALQESEAHPISHESTIRVGGITLLCHIHVGWETCNQCEPGIILGETNDVKYKAYKTVEKTEKHKEELQKLKKKFGIGLKKEGGEKSRKYEDRAEIRRKTVGSECEAFKTETASVFQPIANKNKGFKMLSKMGWAAGETLGKNSSSGISEPVLVHQRPDKVGLGFDEPVTENTITPRERRKQEAWSKARARYKEAADLD